MIVTFAYPSAPTYTGGVAVMYELANGLARRGHQVHFLHGPAWPTRVDRVEDIGWFTFDPAIEHRVVDSFDDPSLPAGEVAFAHTLPRRLGLPVVLVQGHRMLDASWEREAFRARCPKVCVARWLVDVATSYGAPPEQVVHIPLCIDHGTFRPPAPPVVRPLDVALLHHDHREKGWDVGAATIVELQRRRPGIRVGVFSSLPAPADLPPGVRYWERPDQPTLAREVYGRASVFVQASHVEGFGLTAAEAMACGAALVTTDNGGSRDYALPGETALVVPPGDVAGLADGVEALLDDEALRTRISAAGERLVRDLDWDRSAALLEDLLARYVADPAAFQAPPGPDATLGPPSAAPTGAGPVD